MATESETGGEDRELEGSEAEEELSLARRVWDQVGPLMLAVLIALGIRAVVVESYYVPSESMLPTLLIGDHVFVNKFVFGARIPFTDIHLPALRDPERGEIAVFALGRGRDGRICPLDRCPELRSEGFVKRIAGLPGDRVEYRHGVFYLNDEPVASTATGESFTDEGGTVFPVFREALGACHHEILDHPRAEGLSQVAFTVPEDHYFFLGDNRDNSNDSRGWGTVPRTDLKGPVIINYWSWNNQRSWLAMLNPLTWADLLWNEMRWDRIGMDHACEAE